MCNILGTNSQCIFKTLLQVPSHWNKRKKQQAVLLLFQVWVYQGKQYRYWSPNSLAKKMGGRGDDWICTNDKEVWTGTPIQKVEPWSITAP
jgi:hypothetical protein